MTCYHPLKAWQEPGGGRITFHEGKNGKANRSLELPCGRCIGCRLARSRSWAIRIMHEAQMYDSNLFVTLTYDELKDPCLRYRDFQLFMKRLRKARGPVRFFCSGEYGDQSDRPHFHAILFGLDFADAKKWTYGKSTAGHTLWTSKELESYWSHGYAPYGNVTLASAQYCAKYAVKKINGYQADIHYARVSPDTGELYKLEPEMGHMSNRPGIGYPWFLKYWKDVYSARDGVVVDGQRLPSPRYYDRLLERMLPDMLDDKKFGRYCESLKYLDDTTPERLGVREQVAVGGFNFGRVSTI